MVNVTRLIENFKLHTGFDSESYYEKEIGSFVKQELEELGVALAEHTTEESYLREHPQSFPNIFGVLKGNIPGEPILFSAHLDTVSPGKGKKVMEHEDGTITSEGSTVLGADDIAGIVSILEALRVIKENNLSHPDIEILFTVAEEPFCEGSRHFDFSLVHAKKAFVFDLNGPVGTAAVAAPSIISFEIDVKGKAAHAGFAPEEGINALNIAIDTLKDFKTGHIEADTTVNFGTIHGGMGKNIVPEEVKITGEIRSLRHERALEEVDHIIDRFRTNARKAGGIAYCCKHEHIRAFERKESDDVVRYFKKALHALGVKESKLITTYGGSDGNRLNANGIQTIVVACAMENVHTTKEYTTIKELTASADLALKLMIMEDEKK